MIFQDGFESGDVSTGGWTYGGALSVDGTAYSGSYAARIDDTGGLQKIVDTTGHSTVALQFAWYTYSYESGEFVGAYWSLDGSSWNEIATHVGGWEFNQFVLPPEAAGQPALYILFYSGAGGYYDRFRIDDVAVTGGGVPPPNEPPQFTSDPFTASSATAGNAYSDSIAGSATDPDGDPLSYAKLGGPSWLNVASNGALSGTPGSGAIGENSFTIQASDGNGGTDAATLSITVLGSGGNPYARGPDPTVSLLEADLGPFDVASYRPSSTPGFGSGTIWYPTNTSEGPFAAISVMPGYLGSEGTMSWVGPRLASNGFVVITIQPISIYEFPSSRADELRAGLAKIVADGNGSSPISGLVDGSRTGVMGHSMGGGGSLLAARDDSSIDAVIPLAPWNSSTTDFSAVEGAALVVACENDGVAPVSQHALPFYNSIPSSTVDKAFMEFNNEDHYCVMTGNSHYATLGKYIVSWMKAFLDDDSRYDPFLCGAPHQADLQTGEISDYRDNCPY